MTTKEASVEEKMLDKEKRDLGEILLWEEQHPYNWKEEELKKEAPTGKYRVIAVSLIHGNREVIGDFFRLTKAIKYCRKIAGDIIMYHIYDDKGKTRGKVNKGLFIPQ